MQLRLAGTGLGPLFLPAQQDRRLVGVRGLAVAARGAALALFLLFAQRPFALAAFVAPLLQRVRGQAPLFAAARRVVVVVAAMAAQPERGQLDDTLHVAQQFAVMADHQQAARPAPQLFAQQLPPGRVEMVAGLVQDQEVGIGQERTGQRHAHALATAEPAGGHGGRHAVQLHPFQLGLEVFAQLPALAQRFEIGDVAAALLDALQGRERIAQAGQVGDAGTGRNVDLLRQPGHRPRTQAAPAGRRQATGQQPRQHALAHAIAPDQPGAPGVEGFVQIGKQQPAVRQLPGDAFKRHEGSRGHCIPSMPGSPGCRRQRDFARPRQRGLAGRASMAHWTGLLGKAGPPSRRLGQTNRGSMNVSTPVAGHLPMQKLEKIRPSRSSAVMRPVISPSAWCARRSSSAASSR